MTNRPETTSDPDLIFRVADLQKSFGMLQVLRGVSIDFPRGLTTAVLGPSGCGKSVLLKHLIGLLKPDSGEVWYEQTRVDRLSENELGPIRREVGVLFQQGALFDSMSVRENVEFPLVEHTRFGRDERERRVRRVLRLAGLESTIDAMPAQLSGGQRKRVALARAIVLEPKVVLYDEPTTGLDPIRSDVINELIIKLKRELNITSIVVTHDMTSAFKVADRMVMLHEGLVLLDGTPDQFRISQDETVRRFMDGEATDEELAEILAGSNQPPRSAASRHATPAHFGTSSS